MIIPQQILPILQELRLNDRTRQLTTFPQPPIFCRDLQVMVTYIFQYAEEHGISMEVKFKARTMFLAGVRSLPDFAEAEENRKAIALTSLVMAAQNTPYHEIAMNLGLGLDIAPQPYLLSPTHFWLSAVLSMIEQDLPSLTSPTSFCQQMLFLIGGPQICNSVTLVIEFALFMFDTSTLSAEEIFVGCMLYACTYPNIGGLLPWVQANFAEALPRGNHLKDILAEQMAIYAVPDE